MELFTISLPENLRHSVDKLTKWLTEEANVDLHKGSITEQPALAQFQNVSGLDIQCQAVLPHFQLKDHGPVLYKAASKAIAKFVVSEMEAGLLSSIIRRKYRNHSGADSHELERYCHDLLHGKEWDGLGTKYLDADRLRRKAKVAVEVEEYLQSHTELNVAGFTNFRLKPYRKELAEVVEYALDEYVLDKQYQEFISLLKYFVFLQDTKIQMVHLLHKGGHDFILYDEAFQPLDPNPPSDRIVAEMLESEMNIEDMVISSLISVSPKHITIHTRQADMQVIRTIETIFDQRVTVCERCVSCSSSLDELVQP
ncbi:putative sporulation protein YtxC [Paenibacillus alkaliterrae]|uniref:putative sporulation protein YtxC n=1 Tax=Paenibacillus alkaliterrae TaxID=320909 RepID=UPI001F32B2B1|nr:putative sporulation protein YtxC [Paenibacillus alkaliterrae]MCF2940289.1 putative sporulation protein YtxC [Paenibacillus alkaliterrae]